jgi:hypothetical protein
MIAFGYSPHLYFRAGKLSQVVYGCDYDQYRSSYGLAKSDILMDNPDINRFLNFL